MKLKKCIFTLVVMLSGFSATVFAENVAKIGETVYETLQEAIGAAGADATITLLANVTITESTTIDKNITLDLNGHNISETVTDQFGAIYVKKGVTLTIMATTGGEITTDGGVVIGNYGTVIVEGGTINATDDPETDVSIYNFYYQADYYGTMTINDGTVARIWNCGIATLAGGTIVDVDNSGEMEIAEDATVTNIILRDGADAPEVPNAGNLTGAANLRVTMNDGFKAVYDNGIWTATTELTGTVAHIGGTYYYKSLAVALGAAQAEETVTLVSDIAASEIITIDKAITLDGDSMRLTSTAGRAINIDCADEVTIKNLTIVGSTGCERGINIINQPGTTNINNVTISGVSHYALHVATSANAAKVFVTDSNLSGYAAIASYGVEAEVTVTNSELTGINDKADNGSNSFSTIALGSNTISVDEDSKITAKSEEGKALQFIVGAIAEVTGANATISATLNVEGTAQYVGMDLSDEKNNSLTIKEEYKDEVWEEGYATVTQEEGMIAVKLIPTLSLNDDFNETLPTGTVTEVTYTRVLTAENTWYALYLPFQVPVTPGFLDNYDVAEFSKFNNNEGAMSITASLIVGENYLAANTPYLIRAKNEAAKNLSLFLENVIVNAGESQAYSEIEGISLTGVYEETAASDIPNAYALSGGVFKKAASDEQVLKPFRFYLEIEPAQAAALKTIAINVDGEEDGTTSIDNSIFTNNETVVYDLQGRRVENPAKGIYIVNGKKVVIK